MTSVETDAKNGTDTRCPVSDAPAPPPFPAHLNALGVELWMQAASFLLRVSSRPEAGCVVASRAVDMELGRKMTTRRVTAQRKFAQGAYVPPSMAATPSSSGVATATTVRREAPAATHDADSVFRHVMSAHNLLNVVSQGRTHIHFDPIVLVERLREENNHNETSANGKNATQKKGKKVRAKKHIMKLRSRDQREQCSCKRPLISTQVLSKVSKLFALQQPKPATSQPKRIVSKLKRHITKSKHQRKLPKKTTGVAKKVPSSSVIKRKCSRRLTQDGSEFSLDDNRPLTYFRNSSTPNTNVPTIMGPPAKIPPITRLSRTENLPHQKDSTPTDAPSTSKAGQLRLISIEEANSTTEEPCSSTVGEVSRSIADAADVCYYSEERSILKWMEEAAKKKLTSPCPPQTSSRPPESSPRPPETSHPPETDCVDSTNQLEPEQPGPAETPRRCPAIEWETLQQVIQAEKKAFNERCKMCTKCKSINKILEITTLLKRQKKIDCYNNEPNVHVGGSSTVQVIIIDLLPRHPSLMIKIKIQTNPRVDDAKHRHTYNACLIPRSDATMISNEFLLTDNYETLFQLLTTLRLSCGYPPPTLESDNEKPGCSHYQSEPEEFEKPGSFEIEEDDGGILEAPVYYPTTEEFTDPIKYINQIWDQASIYGICKICPPSGFVPPCKVDEEIRFEVFNQYISRLYYRWGPAVRQMGAIKASAQAQSIDYSKPILLEGVEVNIPKLYLAVQRLGGLEKVFNDQKWKKVCEEMKLNTNPISIRNLERIYTKYLLPYDALSSAERQDFLLKSEIAWQKKQKKLLKHASNPLHIQKYLLGDSESSADESDGKEEPHEAEDCVKPGNSMNLAQFKKIAFIFDNFFRHRAVNTKQIETEYWQIVLSGTDHVCVNSASIDTELGLGFTTNPTDEYGKHPWNLKMLSANPLNVLRSIGPALGVTVPTLHLGMIYSTSCWHRDPHSIPWIEYLHQGPVKIWYGVPENQDRQFRKVTELFHPTACLNKSIWLPSDISMVPPTVLLEHGVKVGRLEQKPGEFVLVMPRAYSSSICTGYTISESTYFATERWLENLMKVFTEIRESCEPTMFALEQLLKSIAEDPRSTVPVLQKIIDALESIFYEEMTNRSKLMTMGLKVVSPPAKNLKRKQRPTTPPPAPASQSPQPSTSTPPRRSSAPAWNVRDLDECELCRCTLYLSKVKHIPTRNSMVCLRHALQLLSRKKYATVKLADLELIYMFSSKDILHTMKMANKRLARNTTPQRARRSKK